MEKARYLFMTEILHYASIGIQEEIKRYTDVLNGPEPREYPGTKKEEDNLRFMIAYMHDEKQIIDKMESFLRGMNSSFCFVTEEGWMGDEIHLRLRRESNDE